MIFPVQDCFLRKLVQVSRVLMCEVDSTGSVCGSAARFYEHTSALFSIEAGNVFVPEQSIIKF
jgi:hypothetical protein